MLERTMTSGKTRNKNQNNDQKVIFRYNNKNYGELELRNDSKHQYRRIKFRLHAAKTLNL